MHTDLKHPEKQEGWVKTWFTNKLVFINILNQLDNFIERGMKQISSNKHPNSEIIEIWCLFIQRPKCQVSMQRRESSA